MITPRFPIRALLSVSLLTYSAVTTALTLSPALMHQLGAKPIMAQTNTFTPNLHAQGLIQPAANKTIRVQSVHSNGAQILYISKLQPFITQAQPRFSLLMQQAQVVKNNSQLSRPVRRMMRSLYPKNLTRRAAFSPEIAYSVHVALQDDLYTPMQPSQLRIIDTSEVTVVMHLPEENLAMAKIGENVHIKSKTQAHSAEGRIHYIHTIDPSTHTAEVHIRLPNPNLYFNPNMAVAVEIQAEPQQALLIPKEALLVTGQGPQVLIAKQDGQVEPRAVTLGRANNEQIEIIAGIQAGEYVMTAAQKLLNADRALQSAIQTTTAPQPHHQEDV